jgi:hypothetical protein
VGVQIAADVRRVDGPADVLGPLDEVFECSLLETGCRVNGNGGVGDPTHGGDVR